MCASDLRERERKREREREREREEHRESSRDLRRRLVFFCTVPFRATTTSVATFPFDLPGFLSLRAGAYCIITHGTGAFVRAEELC